MEAKQTARKRTRTEDDAPTNGKMRNKPAVEANTTTVEDKYMIPSELITFLAKTKAEDLFPNNKTIFISTEIDPVVDVWQGLVKHNFLSSPILKLTGNEYIGFLEMADIVNYIVESFGDSDLSKTQDYFKLIVEDELFQNRKVKDILGNGKTKTLFRSITEGFSLFSAIEIIAREREVRRMAIVDDKKSLVGIITQSLIVQFLHKNIEKLGNKKRKPISMCFQSKDIVSVRDDEPAIQGFKKMIHHNLSGIAVVDNDGKLVDMLSLRDLKGIGSDAKLFWRLYQSTKNFRINLKRTYSKNQRPVEVICLLPEDTLEDAIALCSENAVHRLCIIDDEEKPTSMISLRDIFLEVIDV